MNTSERTGTTRTCQHCNTEFARAGSGPKKFCSAKCRTEAGNRRRDAARPLLKCQHCATDFRPWRPDARFCSAKCRVAVLGPVRKRPNRICQRCGKEFWPKSTTRVTYCGRYCAFAAKFEAAEQRSADREAARKKCPECGGPPGRCRAAACIEKRIEARKLSRRVAERCRTCIECSTPFTRANGKVGRYCSVRCRKRALRRAYLATPAGRAYVALQNHKRRRRLAGGDKVDPLAVFARDRYRCHVCGGPCDPNAPPRTPMSPTLDHVVALARGGGHTLTNLATAHQICNSLKSDAA